MAAQHSQQTHTEILMSIDDKYLEVLAKNYKNHESMSYASSLLLNGFRLRSSGGYPIRFMTIEDAWKEDGTFVVVIEYASRYEVMTFSLKESGGEVICRGLVQTKRIKYGKPAVFSKVPDHLLSYSKRALETLDYGIDFEIPYNIYKVSKDVAKCFQLNHSVNIVLRTLEISDVSDINNSWLEFHPGFQFISTLVHMNGGYGVFSKADNKIHGWVLKSILGQVERLYVIDEYRMKGYGSLLLKRAMKDVAENGEDPVAFVKQCDGRAQRFFDRLEFEKVGVCHDIVLNKVF